MRIGLVAGEASGDILGAGLMRALKQQHSAIQFEGIGGPLMEAEGLQSRVPMERLSVMGLVEVLGRLRELLRIRRELGDHWLANPPDAFIGIDAPDFNLGLEKRLRDAGVPTIHYVSPSVWAWRQGRVKKIAKAVDLMLCLLPFEVPFYARHQVDARFVGHTLADDLPLEPDVSAARQTLGLEPDATYLALLPGSRGGEVERLGPLFLDAAERCLQRRPDLQFLLPAATPARRAQIEQQLEGRALPLTLVDGRSREVMTASDAVLLASGTAALEGMLLKKPMVVAYRFAALSWAIISCMVKVKYVALPNLLADEELVPELLQDAATPDNLARTLLEQLNQGERRQQLVTRFTELHRQLKQDASAQSAAAILQLLARRRERADGTAGI
ncbi:lipid-A-disaccharide synthase [Motiliproteus sediminis]|uniref:lipid-A-disaccharide synthase n=1 Tax=Motiliproteus sediminis TaxID=1468178 RepID=UPI001AEF7303|nr:lipid-A-disaccharide synthase [Motiliproteus sediminis]